MRKGFFLSMIAFVLLIYSVSSITGKVSTIVESENTYKELMRATAYNSLFSNFNEVSVRNVLYLLSRKALYDIAHNGCSFNDVNGSSNSIKSAIVALINEGEYVGNGCELYYSNEDKAWATLDGMRDKLADMFDAQGYELTKFDITLNYLNQNKADYVLFNYTVDVEVKDKSGSTSMKLSKDMLVEVEVEGMPDPLSVKIQREMGSTDPNPKPIMFYYAGNQLFARPLEYPKSSVALPLYPNRLIAIQGILYGPLVDASLVDSISDYVGFDKNDAIVYGSFDEVNSVSGFGAYIILEPQGIEDPNGIECNGKKEEWNTFNAISVQGDPPSCTITASNKKTKPFAFFELSKEKFEDQLRAFGSTAKSPYAVVVDGKTTNLPAVLIFSNVRPEDVELSPSKKRFKYNNNLEGGVYVIEVLRDIVYCGYYMNMSSVNVGRSFLGRMVEGNDPYPTFAVFTFLTEKEFLFNDGTQNNEYPSVDYGFYAVFNSNDKATVLIPGIGGCEKIVGSDCYSVVGDMKNLTLINPDDFGLGMIACDGLGVDECFS